MYFDECKTLNDLKAAYKKLALENHPDMGGDVETMKAINAEYDVAFDELKSEQNLRAEDDPKVKSTEEAPEDFKAIIDLLISLGDSITVELCGSWLWISGDTKPVKEQLKACGCKWASKKLRWYWRPNEERSWSRGTYSMNQIRRTYGSQVFGKVEEDEKKALQGA